MDLMDDLDNAEAGGAPRTPKRAPDPLLAAEERQSPPKTARQCDDDDGEPTNRDLMRFPKNMQGTQTAAMHSFNSRLSATEQHLKTVEEATMTRLTNIEAELESLQVVGGGEDAAARARIAELENTIKRMDKLFKQIQETAPAAAVAKSGAAFIIDENIVIIGGFKRETPRGLLEGA